MPKKKIRVTGRKKVAHPYLKRRCKAQGITRGNALKKCIQREHVINRNMNIAIKREQATDYAICAAQGFQRKTPEHDACLDELIERRNRKGRPWQRKSGTVSGRRRKR